MRHLTRIVLGAGLMGTMAGTPSAWAQAAFEVVHAFPGNAGYPAGQLLQADNGVFYGTAALGGPAGAGLVFAFRRRPDGGIDSAVLHAFDGVHGRMPFGGLIQGSDGALYGTTNGGFGGPELGTVFKVTKEGQFTNLHTFVGSDGARPRGGVVQGRDGNLYGATSEGGAAGRGTVFRITAAGELTTLHSFSGPDGSEPLSSLMQASDGNFYGTTLTGGASLGEGLGTVFKVTPGGEVSTLYSFQGTTDGVNPSGALMEGRDGELYGVVAAEPFVSLGRVFKISTAGVLTIVQPFLPGILVATPLLQASDGNFYGALGDGGPAGTGALFRMTPDGTVTLLHSLAEGEGDLPQHALVQGRDGLIYGTASLGGSADRGTLFALTTGGDFTYLGSFVGIEGDSPYGSVLLGSDGRFYGTTAEGGERDKGTVFRMSADGAVTLLHSFSGPDGEAPTAGLVQARDGNLYGVATAGGGSGRGTIFRITPAGAFTLLHAFGPAEGRLPYGPLIQATDGNLYGTTAFGGPEEKGTIFRISPAGAFTMLHAFVTRNPSPSCPRCVPAFPYGPLIQASDGLFYGTTGAAGGPTSGLGATIYRMTAGGQVDFLHAFTCSRIGDPPCGNGEQPTSGLVEGRDGNLYGTTQGPGAVVFRLDATGLNVLHRFTNTGFGDPGGLIQGRDGAFYGVTESGPGGRGSIYRITADGTFTALHVFAALTDGSFPTSALVQAPDGALYGTARRAGPARSGVVYRLTLPAITP